MQSAFSCFRQENRWQGGPYPQHPVVSQKDYLFLCEILLRFFVVTGKKLCYNVSK